MPFLMSRRNADVLIKGSHRLPLTVLNFDDSLTVYPLNMGDNDKYIQNTVYEPSKNSTANG